MKRAAGFTFLEILIALAILAVGLAAAIRAGSGSADTIEALRTRQLAGWIAENRIALLYAERAWPALGESRGTAAMGSQSFTWRQRVAPLPQAQFRRVDIEVFSTPGTAAPVGRLVAFLPAP
ncbi:type II secretion system minor pseudopilin GspI [Quatrionicoccus australiensis]|uniref:type II secretion system minor pseudopilin GspI n=1 Tax=Quatrionicoccus australiensis TaxID=138118 RepID=UPI001CF89D4A|nr:type II secretion system minor pseudopilin GspI [Quatrionicoccus australiensis]UCV16384.1 type II secretion system minor pseudopilin GspI [Quatrionicoccus australiensis]